MAWIALAFGQDRAAKAITHAGAADVIQAGNGVRALVALAAAGLILGLIATLRVSPVGAVVTGAAYLASYVGVLIVGEPVLEVFSRTLSVAGRSADLSIPLRTGTAALLGAMLLVAVFSVGRWRRWPRPSEPVDTPAFGPHGALGANGLSADAPGTGPSYASLSPGPAPTGVRASNLSWPDALRDSGPH